jgi:hypothetical protein
VRDSVANTRADSQAAIAALVGALNKQTEKLEALTDSLDRSREAEDKRHVALLRELAGKRHVPATFTPRLEKGASLPMPTPKPIKVPPP